MDQHKLWRETQKSAALGTKPTKFNGRLQRITTNNHLVFEFGADGKWRWLGLVGD